MADLGGELAALWRTADAVPTPRTGKEDTGSMWATGITVQSQTPRGAWAPAASALRTPRAQAAARETQCARAEGKENPPRGDST